MTAFARHEDPNHRPALPAAAVIPPRDPLLVALGPMADVLVTLDFECYYSVDYGLKKLTTEAYVRDPRFETIGVGVKVGQAATVWLEEWEFRAWTQRVNWKRVALCAHHAQLDAFILSHHYDVKPGFLVCTMSMARALHGVSGVGLDTLGPKYGLGEKGDEVAKTKGKHRADFTQAEWERFGVYCINDVTLTAGLFAAMRRGFPTYELWLIDTTIRGFTEPRFRANRSILEKARDDEREKKKRLLLGIAQSAGVPVDHSNPQEAARIVLSSSDKFAALLRSMGEEPPTKLNKKGKTVWAFAKTDPGMTALEEHERDDIRAIVEARLAVKSTITETRAERIMGIADRGAVPFYLKYCGAHTHRFSGGDKMNPQNFTRGGDLRDAIESAPDEELAVADSGQIEARVLPWFAGDHGLLETFRRNDLTGGDFYSDRGSVFFLKPISKKDTPIERQLSKNMILGLGFGMGWGKFGSELLKGMLGSDPVQFKWAEVEKFRVDVAAFEQRKHGREGMTCGQEVERLRRGGIRLSYRDLLTHCAVADHLVRLYRDTSPRITALWRSMDTALRVMEDPKGDGGAVRMTVGPLRIARHAIIKPSGLAMHYPGLRKGKDGYRYLGGKSGREWSKVYGALIVENCVQSLARDIVCEQVLWTRAKYATAERRSVIGTTTHDEIVAIVPKGQGRECYAYMVERMKIPPAWCADLPLNATGGFGQSYGAIK